MGYHVVSVTFDVDAQQDPKGRFSVPTTVCAAIGVASGDDVVVTVGDSGTIQTRLKSGLEIYGAELAGVITPGERVRVTISRFGQVHR